MSDLLAPYKDKVSPPSSDSALNSADNSDPVKVHSLKIGTRQKGGDDTSPLKAKRKALKRSSREVLRSEETRPKTQGKKRKKFSEWGINQAGEDHFRSEQLFQLRGGRTL